MALGSAAFKIPAALIIPRTGARAFLSVSLVTWGVITACCAAIKTAGQFFVLRFILGIAESGTTEGGRSGWCGQAASSNTAAVT